MQVPLGTEIFFGQGHIVLDGMGTQRLPERGTAPNFWPMSVV